MYLYRTRDPLHAFRKTRLRPDPTVPTSRRTFAQRGLPCQPHGRASIVCLWVLLTGALMNVDVSTREACFADSKGDARPLRLDRVHPTILALQGISRLAIDDPNIASVTLLADDRVAIHGRKAGTTTLTIWKNDEKSSVPITVVDREETRISQAADARPIFEAAKVDETPKVEEPAKETSAVATPAAGGEKPTPWVKLSVAPAIGQEGEILFTVNYGNRSLSKATKVVVRDALPPELEYVKDSASNGGSYDAENRELVWKFEDLPQDAEGSQQSITFRAKPVGGPGVSKIFNVATIECSEHEALFASNTVLWETSSATLTAVFAMPETFLVKNNVMMPLLDVHGEEYQAAVDRLEGLSVVSGYPDRTFKPDAPVTRAESAKMLVLGAELKEHRDATRLTLVLTRPARVTLTLTDSGGRVVRTLVRNQQKLAGDHTIPWDGRADTGEYVKPGTFTYSAKAVDAKGMESSLDGNLSVLGVEPSKITGTPSFKDVKPTDWFAGYVAEAEDRQFVNGYPDRRFRPKRNLTRVEATAMVVRALGLEKEAAKNSGKDVGFTDARKVPRWATGYVAVAATTAPKARDQLIVGYPGNTFMPENPIRRTEAAAIVSRFVDRNVNRQQIVSGSVAAGATLTINGKTIRADVNGRFRVSVNIIPNEVTTIAVLAQ